MGDTDQCSIPVLLDLSAAIDTTDHTMLIDRLRNCVRITNTAQNWLISHLSKKQFCVGLSSSFLPDTSNVWSASGLHFSPNFVLENSYFHCYADTQLYMTIQSSEHVKRVVQSCFYQLRNISKITSFVLCWSGESHPCFYSSWLHYCNSLYSCHSQKAMSCLQLVQNSAFKAFNQKYEKWSHHTNLSLLTLSSSIFWNWF